MRAQINTRGMLGRADVCSRGPLWGSSALLPPKPSVSARPNLPEPSPDDIYCAVSVCVQPRSSLIPLQRAPDPLNSTSYSLKTLAPQQKHTRGRVCSFIWTLKRCVLLNVALHLSWVKSTGFASCFCFEHPRSSREGGVHSHCCGVRFANESTYWTGSFEWCVLNDSVGGGSHRTGSKSLAVTKSYAKVKIVLKE